MDDSEAVGGIVKSTSSIDAEPETEEFVKCEKILPFIKIIIRETDDILLYESNSITVPKDSDEAPIVEASNSQYDYMTIGKGKNRRTSEAEAQTTNILYKTRAVNTERIKKSNIGTFVSNYDMFDTYADLARKTTSLDSLDKQVKIEITTYSLGSDDPDEKLRYIIVKNLLENLIYFLIVRTQTSNYHQWYCNDCWPEMYSVKDKNDTGI